MKSEYFECRCSCDEHTVRFMLDKDDPDDPCIFVTYFLRADYRWYRRLWMAFKYILGGKQSKYGHFDEMILRPEDYPRLREVLDNHR